MIDPEWVKLIPANSIPVFCFAPETLDGDFERCALELRAFFAPRKVLVMRGNVDIKAIVDTPNTTPNNCICGGEPHASHCPACRDPFLRGLL